jgi:ABC-type iron transport system FetAB ATPase subunit
MMLPAFTGKMEHDLNARIPTPPGNDDAALCVRELSSSHAGPFTLDVAAGECLTVRGPSGAGKSLLLRMIADLDVSNGSVSLHGRLREQMSAPEWRRNVVYQAAEPAWWEATAARHFPPDRMPLVRALLPRLALAPATLDTEISRLSTGERQRMALIRSLACGPQVLLLDEPTAALDHASTLLVEDLLREQLQAKLAIVLVTHSAEQAARLGDKQMSIAKAAVQ